MRTEKIAPDDKKIIDLVNYAMGLIRRNIDSYKIAINEDRNSICLLSPSEIILARSENGSFSYIQGTRSGMIDIFKKYWDEKEPFKSLRKEAVFLNGDKKDHENPETNPFYDKAWRTIKEVEGLGQEELTEEDYRKE